MVLQMFWECKLVHSIFSSLISQSNTLKKLMQGLQEIMERTVYADVHPVVWQDICKMKPCTNWDQTH